jgi:hypothetical protein
VTAAEAVVVDTEITVRARSWRLTKFRNGAIECYAATGPLTLDWTKRRRGAWVKIASATFRACMPRSRIRAVRAGAVLPPEIARSLGPVAAVAAALDV